MPSKTKFQEGEKVLCFHGPLLYEAKCVKAEVKEKQVRYHIHYNGWNKNWDEWVPESRVLKLNEAGLQKQKELMKAHHSAGKGKGSKAGRKPDKKEKEKPDKEKDKEEKEKPPPKEKEEKETKEKEKEKDVKKTPSNTSISEKKKEKKEIPAATPTSTPPPPPATPTTERLTAPVAAPSPASEPKRKRPRMDATVESFAPPSGICDTHLSSVTQEEVFMTRIEVKIKVPDELKPWLVDDWDLITRQKMLLSLPCKNSVDNILDDYIKVKTAKSNVNKDAVMETMAGVKEYFNVMLGTQLLYKFERPQYGEILTEHPDKPMSSIYGATHLLRLFVRLGQMLAYTSLDEKCVQVLLTHIHDFLKYMLKNGSTLFSHTDYGIAPPEYHRKAI